MKSIAAFAGATAGQFVQLVRHWRARQCSCAELHNLIATLPHVTDSKDKLAAVDAAFARAFAMPIAVFTPSTDGICVRHHNPAFLPDENDSGHADHAFRLCTATSRNVGGAMTMYLPLITARACVGVLAFRGTHSEISKRSHLIESFAGQTALALLRSDLEDEARYTKALRDMDRFQKTMLDSIAHNLRTPLASVIGALSTLQEDAAMLDGAMRRDLVDTARQEADRLNRLVGNLLDFSRLESGSVHVRSDRCDVQDVIGAALEQLGPALRDREMNLLIAPELPAVPMDFVLITQVIVNLIDNALKYSPQNTPISVGAQSTDTDVTIAVSDDGDGIPGDNPERAFNKFDRAGRSGEIGGIGLGLSICKCFVEAHAGSLKIERRLPRGTTVAFTLPVRPQAQEARA